MYLLDLEGDVKAAAAPVRGVEVEDPESFMEGLRAKAAKVVLQALDARYVADINHLWAVVRQAWKADKRGVSKVRFDLDILLRLACDSRLTHALKTVGLKKGVLDVIFVAVGRGEPLQRSVEILGRMGDVSNDLLQPTSEKEAFLRRYHSISDLALQSILLKQERLASILAERAAVALSGRR
ncbi:MAG: KEOPS complex subunit Cgi121 [Nitrososphaerales archaeon]